MGIIKLGERTYYLSGRNNIGIYLTGENRVWLIDCGGSADEGKKILDQISERGWTVEGIAMTHYHADHTGGAGYIQQQTGCLACADPVTAGLAATPLMVSALLYGGYPPAGMRHGYYTADPYISSPLDRVPKELEILPLDGHAVDMVGYRTPDGVAFVGDATISSLVLESDGLIYVYNVGRFFKTLDWMDENLAGLTVVPGHSRPTKDIVELNVPIRARIEELVEFIFQTCIKPTTRESLIKQTLDHFGCKEGLGKYVTMQDAVLGALTYLLDCGRMEFKFNGNVNTCESIESFYNGLF